MNKREMETLKLQPKKKDVHIERQVYKTEELNNEYGYKYPENDFIARVKSKATSNCNFEAFLLRTIPILDWLPQYEFKKNIIGDILSGATVAIMHIPHGMAYGILGHLHPVVGIYMGFFPVLVYTIFGTSRHVSIGTYAIACMMIGSIVADHTNPDDSSINSSDDHHYTPIQVATTVTFTVALIQVAMYLFRLGIISTLMSDTLVSAFTCGSAFHVASIQLQDLFGVTTKKREGIFKIVMILYDLCEAIPSSNIAAVIVSLIFTVLLILNGLLLKPRLARVTRIPFPIELIALICSTIMCYLMNLSEKYNLDVIGPIPTGLPHPALPAFSLIPEVIFDAFTIAMITYTVTISLGVTLAQKSHYEIDSNQELLAMGFSNAIGSFFSCMPITASLSRSLVQHEVGGVTQVASIISCSILLAVLLWMGPLFTYLPNCVLATIIVYALRGMLMQFTALKKYWKLNGWDVTHWLVTFLTTVFIGIEIGLLAAIVTSIMIFIIQGYRPYVCLLGVVPNTDIYLDVALYKDVKELPNIKIFFYSGAVNFAVKSTFSSLLFEKLGFDPLIELSKMKKGKDVSNRMPKCVILDFSSVTKIDPSGIDMLRQVASNYSQLSITVYLAACSGPVYKMFMRCEQCENGISWFLFFPTVHDAVLYAQNGILKDV